MRIDEVEKCRVGSLCSLLRSELRVEREREREREREARMCKSK